MHPPKDDTRPVCSTKYDTKYVIQCKYDSGRPHPPKDDTQPFPCKKKRCIAPEYSPQAAGGTCGSGSDDTPRGTTLMPRSRRYAYGVGCSTRRWVRGGTSSSLPRSIARLHQRLEVADIPLSVSVHLRCPPACHPAIVRLPQSRSEHVAPAALAIRPSERSCESMCLQCYSFEANRN